jgi:hypothetical protein
MVIANNDQSGGTRCARDRWLRNVYESTLFIARQAMARLNDNAEARYHRWLITCVR